MRKNEEITRAIATLKKKGDRISLKQSEILEGSYTEKQVFEKYVCSVSEEQKDDQLFYALRDAARYAAGKLTLEELIPDADKYPVKEVSVTKTQQTTTSTDKYQALLRRVKVLEGLVEDLCKERRSRSEYQKKPDTDRADFITQNEAKKYVGCSKDALRAWQLKGYITVYIQGGRVYYRKSELENSPKVQSYIFNNSKKE